MEPLQKFLERAFATYDRVLEELSLRWREHANRRTIVILIVGGALMTYLFLSFVRPPENFPINELVTVPDGASLADTSAIMQKNGVVRSATALRIVVALSGHQREVHAGDYLFKEPLDMFSIARAISIGAYGLEPLRIRIPEGATTREMTIILKNRLLRFDEKKFLTEAQPEEGFLFPDTYFFLPNATEDLVIRTMRQNFDTQVMIITPEIKAFGKPLQDVVTMASLVEREARNPSDRRMIAGVLWNRLDRGMLLQVDAAFLYTLGKGSFKLTTQDLTTDSPYNTYLNKGLPPGPIGSPSLDSLRAAVTPTKSSYLYYLADRKGVTHYSKTYAEHLRKKNLYLN